MRIRKNASKLSAFLQPNAASPPLAHNNNHESNNLLLCQLNQSPWDIITFPSSAHSSSPSLIHQFDDFEIHYNVNVAANWSSVDSVGSIQSVASTKNSLECEYDNVNVDENVNDTPKDYKSDNKGWQCARTAKKSNMVCDDELVDHEKINIDKKARLVSRSCRPKKRAGAIVSNQNEFYYYSGFGPSWGKKRGESGNKCTTFNTASSSNSYETRGVVGYIHVEDEQKRVSSNTDTIRIPCPCEVGPIKKDLGCVDEEPANIIEKVKSVKKRGRKPIKARSLKSLM